MEQHVGDQPEARAEKMAKLKERIAQLVRDKDNLMEKRDKIVEELRPLQEELALLRGRDVMIDIHNASIEVIRQELDQKLSDVNKEIEALSALVGYIYM